MTDASIFGSQLASPPTDGISGLRFSAANDLLLACSWDGLARLYDARHDTLRGSYSHQGPVLDACFQDHSTIFTAGLDSFVKRYDFFGHAETVIGQHSQPVRCVEWLREQGIVATGSWNNTLRLWDPRMPLGKNCVSLIPLPGKVFSMAQSGSRMVVGTSGRHVLVFDLRSIKSGQPEQVRDSSLKYQTRCIRCYPNGTGYALSSIEGRVAMEYFDISEQAQAKKYAFKCHRKSEAGRDVVYPVNAIAFHPVFGTFATGGCDWVVNIWDGEHKKRLFQISKYPTSIAAMAFNADGSLLAVASSYTHEQGDIEHPPDMVYLRRINESEVKPKPRR